MLLSHAAPTGTSIYSSLCWDCLWKQRANRLRRTSTLVGRPKRQNGKNGVYNRQRPSLHTTTKLRQQVASLSIDPTPLPFVPSLRKKETRIPIREQLAQWQKDRGNPLSDLLPTLAQPQKQDESSPFLEDEEVEIPQSTDLADGEELFPTRGIYYNPGDLVELNGNPDQPPKLAIYIRNISGQQDQVLTIRGKWMNVQRNAFPWTVPGFLDPKLVEPLLPHLPTAEVAEEMLEQAMVMDISVPRIASAPLINSLNDFSSAADEVYRKNAARLDNAHSIISDKTDLRFGYLEKMARILIGGTNHPEHALYAVRRALVRAGICFGADKETSRTGLFQIRSQEQVELIKLVQQWLRDYQESRVRMAAEKIGLPPRSTAESVLEGTHGARVVHGFIAKCIPLIEKSRKRRVPTTHGFLGPSGKRYPLTDPKGCLRKTANDVEFSEEEVSIIRFLEMWCLQYLFSYTENIRSICPIVLRGTGLYQDFDTDVKAGLMFLMEIGVLEPYVNRTLYDVNLLLPTSQHSRPIERLASQLNSLDRSKINMPDTMARLRRDFKDLTVFCIDSATAQEIDDGISVERIEDSTDVWIHVHVANPTAFIDRNTIFAKMASHLTETFYSPDTVYPMLPPWMSRDMFGVAAGRPTLTFSAKLNAAAEIIDYKIQNGIVRKIVKLTYKDLPDILGVQESAPERISLVIGGERAKRPLRELPELDPHQLEDLRLIHSLSTGRYQQRRKRGGINFNSEAAETSVYHQEDQFGLPQTYPHRKFGMFHRGDPVIELHGVPYQNWFKQSAEDTTEHLVREMMLIACDVAGRFAADRKIPIIFRCMQKNPTAAYTHEEFNRDVVRPAEEKFGDIPLALGLQLVQSHGRSVLRSAPAKHTLLGLDQYSQVTSPLRRYGDMITHWQIESALREEDAVGTRNIRHANLQFSDRQIKFLIDGLKPRERLIRKAKGQCQDHWITQFFFRAYRFHEIDLPRNFPVVINSHFKSHMTHSRFSFGTTLDFGTRVYIDPRDASEDFRNRAAIGDVWEVEVQEVNPFRRSIDVLPVRLLQKEHDLSEFGLDHYSGEGWRS